MTVKKIRGRYAAAAVGTALFAFVYELFSHRVYSAWMLCAFLIPLAGGAILLALLPPAGKQVSSVAGRCLYGSGIAALTAGSRFQGMLEIYGTTSRLAAVYWIAGGCLTLAGVLWRLSAGLGKKKNDRPSA